MEKNNSRINKRWTQKEKEYLINNWGKIKIDSIAKTLNRNTKSIQNQAYYLGLGTQMKWYSPREVGRILGIHKSTIVRYMDSGKLEHVKDRTKHKRRMSSELQIKTFMKKHQDLWDSRKVTINLYKKETKWYVEKQKEDNCKPLNTNSYYTNIETKILIDRYLRGWSIKEIAKELSRNERSVYNKLIKVDFGRKYKF